MLTPSDFPALLLALLDRDIATAAYEAHFGKSTVRPPRISQRPSTAEACAEGSFTGDVSEADASHDRERDRGHGSKVDPLNIRAAQVFRRIARGVPSAS